MKHVKLFEQFIAEGRNGVGKYNTVKKAMKAIRNEYGPTPTPQSVASFITDNYYDVTEVDREDDDPRADDKIADLIASYKFDLDEWEIAWEDAQNESVVTEAKNTIGLAFKEEQDYLDFVEFIKDEKGSIKKDFGWDSKTKSWEVIMDVKVLDRIYGEGTPSNKESGWYGGLPGDFESVIIESVVTEGKFDGIADLLKSLHFEIDEKTAEEKKIALGKKQGEVSRKKQIESAEYSLRRFRKEIKFGDGTYLGVFLPGSYDAATSTLGDGPHKKAVAKIKWSQKKYNQWLEDMSSNGGAENAFDMAQNAKNEPGLIDWVKKSFRGEDPLQRVQWDIEGYAESNKTTMKYVQLFEQFIK